MRSILCGRDAYDLSLGKSYENDFLLLLKSLSLNARVRPLRSGVEGVAQVYFDFLLSVDGRRRCATIPRNTCTRRQRQHWQGSRFHACARNIMRNWAHRSVRYVQAARVQQARGSGVTKVQSCRISTDDVS